MHNNPLSPELMAIVNITHNSFSDAKQFMRTSQLAGTDGAKVKSEDSETIFYDEIIDYCNRVIAEGASILDIGGESTNPGAPRTDIELERQRVIPIAQALAQKYCISVDTMRSAIAREALACGVSIINDVSGGLADPQMATVIAEHPDCRWIISHWAPLPQMNWLSDMKEHFDSLIHQALSCGVREAQIILDPGIGFAKNAQQNWDILNALGEINNWGFPVLLGASRKRFLTPYGEIAQDRDSATAIITALISRYHPWAIRVHNVELNRIALEIARNFTAE